MLTIPSIKHFLNSAGLVIGFRASGVVLGLFAQLLLARTLETSQMGLFFMVTSLATILGICATLGYPLIVPKFIVHARRLPDPAKTLNILNGARLDIFRASALMIAVGTAIIYGLEGGGTERSTALLIGLSCALPLALLRFNGAIANAKKQFILGFFPDLALRPALFALFLASLWLIGQPLHLEAALIAFAAIAFLVAGGQHLLTYQSAKPNFSQTIQRDSMSKSPWDHRMDALSMLIGMLFLAAAADLAIVFTSWFVSPDKLAIFGICLKVSMICGFAVNAVQQVAVRDLGEALSGQGKKSINRIINTTNATAVFLALGSLVGVLAIGDKILALFGPQYVQGYWCLAALMSVNVGRALAGPSLQLISLVHQERLSPGIFLFTLVAMLVLLWLLAPMYGLLGATLAFWIAMTLWPFWLSFVVWRKSGVSPVSVGL